MFEFDFQFFFCKNYKGLKSEQTKKIEGKHLYDAMRLNPNSRDIGPC